MSTEFPEINEDDEDDQEIMLTYKKIWNSVDQHIQENEYDDPIFYYMEEGEGSLFIDNNTLTKISVYITESMKTTDISYWNPQSQVPRLQAWVTKGNQLLSR